MYIMNVPVSFSGEKNLILNVTITTYQIVNAESISKLETSSLAKNYTNVEKTLLCGYININIRWKITTDMTLLSMGMRSWGTLMGNPPIIY